MEKNNNQTNISEEIFKIFLEELKKNKVSEEITDRLNNLLFRETQITDKNIKSAIFPKDI